MCMHARRHTPPTAQAATSTQEPSLLASHMPYRGQSAGRRGRYVKQQYNFSAVSNKITILNKLQIDHKS